MNEQELLSFVGDCRTRTQREINNTYIWCSVALSSLRESMDDTSFLARRRFSVPSNKPAKTVPRNAEDVKRIVADAVDSHLYKSLLVYLVAQVEACLSDVLREVLLYDPRRIKCRVDGINHMKNVDVDTVINSASRIVLLRAIVDSELISVSYGSPQAQLTYLEKVLGIGLDDDIKLAWREIKASRDIIVHNSGIINSVYVDKSGVLARGVPGEVLPVDEGYFQTSAVAMKTLVGRVSSKFQEDSQHARNKKRSPKAV